MIGLHGLEHFVAPPPRLPDLHAALFSIYGAANLVVVYCLTVVWLFSVPDAPLVQYPSQSQSESNYNYSKTFASSEKKKKT